MSGRHQVSAAEREDRPFGEEPIGPVEALGIARATADGRAPLLRDRAFGAHASVLIGEAGAVVLPSGGEHGPAFAEAAALVAGIRADWLRRPISMDEDTTWARRLLAELRTLGFGIYGRRAP